MVNQKQSVEQHDESSKTRNEKIQTTEDSVTKSTDFDSSSSKASDLLPVESKNCVAKRPSLVIKVNPMARRIIIRRQSSFNKPT